MQRAEKPTRTQHGTDREETYEHPAFGMIGMNIITGGPPHLFGSDIKHNQRVVIRIKAGEHKRNLSNDWYSAGARRPMIEVELSHSQFAEFITSPGRGDGIPCTITEFNGADMPSIDQVETKQEMFRREIEESAKRRLAAISGKIAELGDLIESGRLPKNQLRAIHSELARHAHQLPGAIGFVVEQGEEALEAATTAARVSIEATINHHISRLGHDAARAIGLIGPDRPDMDKIR